MNWGVSGAVEAEWSICLRYAREAIASQAGTDVPVIGLIGHAVPREIVAAAGARPISLAARAEDYSRDAAPMEREHEAEVRSLFLQATSGAFAFCDAIAIASTSDGYRYLFQYLTEMRRTGQGAPLPPIWLVDLLLGDSPSVGQYDLAVLRRLAEQVGHLTGKPVREGSLASATVAEDRRRMALGHLDAVRRSAGLPGADALALIHAGAVLPPADHAALIEAALVAAASDDIGTRTPRLIVAPSVPLYHDRLHVAAAHAGVELVAEDDAWGTRWAGPTVGEGGDPWARLLDYYRLHTPSPRQPTERREAWLRAALDGDADGVVFYVPPEDQYYGWRLPALLDAAAAAGMPALLLRDEVLDPDSLAASVQAMGEFAATLGRVPA